MSSVRRSPVVWIVDDSRLDADRARRVLSSEYTLATFHDGSAALEQLSAGIAPDVMVLDWVMPGISGVEVCRFLRAAGAASQKIGVLLLTVHRDTAQIVEGFSAGANDYLAKPYEDEELRARVSSLVRTRELVDRLERAESENRRLLETAPDPLLVTDGEGRLTFVNEKGAHIFKESREELLGKAVAELVPELSLPEPDTSRGESIMPSSDVTIGGRRFSPTHRTLPEGSTASVMISLRDVTERRLLEERRLDFYSIIAHDLRTPLNAMTLRLALMIESSRTKPAGQLSGDLAKLDQRLRSLVEMINDFLDLASLEGASYRLDRGEVDLLELVRRTCDDFSPLIERGQLRFEPTVCNAERANVPGDERRLMQVLGNLISNAIKFTPVGGTIGVAVQVDDRQVEVAVTDTGTGIAPRLQATLFKRYMRAEHSVGGTGLGLMIVREIVQAHGGVVGVDSVEGAGSRFWIRLPRTTGIALYKSDPPPA